MATLKDLAELRGLAKELKKKEKEEEKKADAAQVAAKKASYTASKLGMKASDTKAAGHQLLPDGSNATIEDYFGKGEPYMEDKFDEPYERVKRNSVPEKTARLSSKYLEVDLHIQSISHPKDLPRNKYLEYQMNVFRKTMENNLSHKGKKIVFIHGVGDGVLRHAIIEELDAVYWKCRYQDAPFHEYGMGGALLVTIA